MRAIARAALLFLSPFFGAALPTSAQAQGRDSNLRFEITFPAERSRAPLDGRLLVLISTDTAGEPLRAADGHGRSLR